MSVASDYETRKCCEGWFRRSETWLDDRGKPAWIVAMVLGFVLFWPVGLALLLYMIFGKKMFARSCRRHHDETARLNRRHGFRSSGNTAFDAYKADTLQRLMNEQEQFEAFLDRLRAAKDQREFDAFMDERAEAARADSRSNDTEDEAEDEAEART
ncbi:MAG: hypothetical protein CSA74_08125 [Rhodobacterales bacterium]|nr:MAG: hypothetical protein CSA74_08125 [Rhodobacterales bacterium]